MNREIKFRAWDDGVMIYSHTNIINHSYFQLKFLFERVREDAIIMQFTGLHDKNGKEIYEGDIVKGHRPATEYLKQKDWVGIIEFAKVRCAFVVKVKHLDGIDTFDNIVSCDSNYQVDSETLTDYQYKVIGNIYETPNLCNT